MPYYLVSRFIYLDKKRVCEIGSFAEACIHEGYEPFTKEFKLARNRKKNQSSIVKAAVESVQESFTTNFKWAVKIDVVENQK